MTNRNGPEFDMVFLRTQPRKGPVKVGRTYSGFTSIDRKIYSQMPFVGRLMVHMDRKDKVMLTMATQIMTEEAKHRIWAGNGLSVEEYRTL